ncbi:MAG: acyl-CoA dehydrogenase, partial [Deltaproteobacteria bacterium]
YAGVALGLGRAAVAEGASYAGTRTQFGRPIADFQAISFKLADIATEVDAARLLVHDAARALAADPDDVSVAARALLLANDAAKRAADEALQIHGGYGYTRDFPVERLWRDARALSALEGPPETLALEVAQAALGGP